MTLDILDRKQMVEEVKDYFASSDQWQRLVSEIQDPDPINAHIHMYVNASIHPESLEELIRGFFKIIGWPITRRFNHIGSGPNLGCFESILPKDKVFFGFYWLYNPEVALRPANGGEGGSNLLKWDKRYVDTYYSQFDFRKVGPAEEKAIKDYFKSKPWEENLKVVVHPDSDHVHINVDGCVHPDYIKKFALEDLEARGWKVSHVSPNVYHLGDDYLPKLVFFGIEPNTVYDISWKFCEDVVLVAAREAWRFPEIGCDAFTRSRYRDMVWNRPYFKLNSSEIEYVLKACEEKIKRYKRFVGEK
jgi:hypothetical protein